jgi:uncharacterized protein (DUF305 family)
MLWEVLTSSMRGTAISSLIPIVLLAAGAAGCRTTRTDSTPVIVQPGAPGQATRVIGAAQASDLSRVQHTAADIKFMQGMIGHHAQAIEMTALIPSRTAREDMKMLGLRISLSQEDEIKMMRHWLEVRGAPLPSEHAHHMPGGMMPGMLSPQEMERLAAAKGPQFDTLFLEGMIKHHEGALTMVKELFATAGAGQESDIFAFATDVEADQQMEIDRMVDMLRPR